MDGLNFDELNTLGFEEFAELFFEEMEIPKKKKRERVELSMDIYEVMLLLFELIGEQKTRELVDSNYDLTFFRENYQPLVLAAVKPKKKSEKEYVNKYVNEFTDDVLFATMIGVGAYWLSNKRAAIIALNEANTVCGYVDLLEAIRKGYTRKQWLTMKDDKVRPTHDILDDVIKPINGYFEVGSELMLYPHDYVNCNDPNELVNCRCSLIFLL